MTTDSRHLSAGFPGLRGTAPGVPAARGAIAGAALLAGWLAALTLPLTLGAEPPAILVVAPAPGLLARLGPDVRLQADHALGLVLQSDTPGLAPRLWRLGALVLLPAGLAGCAAG